MMKVRWIDKFLGNDGSFEKGDISNRKIYLLNALLAIIIISCSFFVALNIFLFDLYNNAIVSAAIVLSTLFTLIFFKKTGKYKPAAYITIAIIIFGMIGLFYFTQNKHYALYWLSILPPVAYLLLGRKSARIILIVFYCYILFYILSNKIAWAPAEFDNLSVFNIAVPTLGLVLIMAYSEKNRSEAWAALKKINLKLEQSQDELQLILDSAAEAIYGLDLNGNCTFCNKSCIKLLGYNDQSELLGKNMHWQIHHSKRDGSYFPPDECRIFRAFLNGEGAHVDDEVFWRADGSSFDAEYHSYPQEKNGEIVGAVVTFTDISERKRREAEIEHLSCYDILTNLLNRRCFDESRKNVDKPENLPLSVIFADINGLKMTNDIFGHAAGDELIKKSSEILQQVCRQNDIVARIGGDEFVIMLPNTSKENSERILERIKSGFADAHVAAIKCSISLGLDIKHSPEQSLDEVIANAENAMYKDKTINRKFINKDIIDTIIQTLHSRNPEEKRHSIDVRDLCSSVGTALHLSENKISKLKRAAYLHDIGKIVLDEHILTKVSLTEEEFEKMQQHSAVGYRILNLFDDTLDLAEYVYGHHEKWDGSGYPRGLKGEQIPLLSRIISVAEAYDRVLNRGELPFNDRKAAALNVIKSGAGTQFDPQIVEVLINLPEDGLEGNPFNKT